MLSAVFQTPKKQKDSQNCLIYIVENVCALLVISSNGSQFVGTIENVNRMNLEYINILLRMSKLKTMDDLSAGNPRTQLSADI